MARLDNYERRVKPYLDKVAEMALTMTEAQIAKTLGVSYSAFRRYKNAHEELMAAIKKGRKELVCDLKSMLIQKAKGFDYTETTETEEQNKVTGKLELTKRETKTRHACPDVAAINLLLKNYDSEWRNDPAEYELKKQALELQKKKVDEAEW